MRSLYPAARWKAGQFVCDVDISQAEGHRIETIEGMGERPGKGWKTN